MNPNAKDARGLTPLHLADDCRLIYWGPPDLRAAMIVEYLLFAGADPNLPFSYGGEPRYTMLHRAAFVGNMVLVPMLVGAGANVNTRDSRGFTPLHSAARCDFRMSCDDCTNPSRDDFFTRWKQGATPVIQYLLQHGADITARTKKGESVLDMFANPCPPESKSCDPSTLKEWPVGTGLCRKAYLLVQGKLAGHQRQP